MDVVLLTDNLLARIHIEDLVTKMGARMIPGQGEEEPVLLVVDLAAPDALAKIRAWRARSPDLEIIAFGPHVDGDRFKSAREAGATSLVARSKIAERLSEHLGRRKP